MKKFMLVIQYGGGDKPVESANQSDIMEGYQEWTKSMGERIVVAHKLADEGGRRIYKRGGDVTDGPYVETKESIGGYYVIEASALDDAIEVARGCPTVHLEGGTCEVREVEF